jgi:hypothetical protein
MDTDERIQLALRTLEACEAWVEDTGDCHFCDHANTGHHDDECLLRSKSKRGKRRIADLTTFPLEVE